MASKKKKGKNRSEQHRKGRPPQSYVAPTVAAVSALVFFAAATTDQWRGAILTEVQVLVVGLVAWWGLRR